MAAEQMQNFLSLYLNRLMEQSEEQGDGKYEIKHLNMRNGGFKFYIWSNDHLPPHFHVKNSDGSIDNRFEISDCTPMDSGL